MTDLELFVGGTIVILGFFAALAGLVVAVSLVITYERDQRDQRRTNLTRRQEREVQDRLRTRTGQVQAAPRLAPLADVVQFPDRDAAA